MENTDTKLKEQIVDIAKDVLLWAVVTGISFVYWLAVLMIASLLLVSVWHVKFDQLLDYSVILMVITSVIYIGIILKRRLR